MRSVCVDRKALMARRCFFWQLATSFKLRSGSPTHHGYTEAAAALQHLHEAPADDGQQLAAAAAAFRC